MQQRFLFYKQLPDKRLYARNSGILVSPGLYLTTKTADRSPSQKMLSCIEC